MVVLESTGGGAWQFLVVNSVTDRDLNRVVSIMGSCLITSQSDFVCLTQGSLRQ